VVRGVMVRAAVRVGVRAAVRGGVRAAVRGGGRIGRAGLRAGCQGGECGVACGEQRVDAGGGGAREPVAVAELAAAAVPEGPHLPCRREQQRVSVPRRHLPRGRPLDQAGGRAL
jgi:hypothetical protein